MSFDECFKTDSPPNGPLFYRACQHHTANVLSKLNLDVSYVANLSIEEQCKYADPVTVANVNQKWLQEQSEQMYKNGISTALVNATSIGNTAYLALHSTSSKTRESAQKVLESVTSPYQRYSYCVIC